MGYEFYSLKYLLERERSMMWTVWWELFLRDLEDENNA